MRRIYLPLIALLAMYSTSCTKDSTSSISSDNILVYSTQSIAEEASNDGTFNSVISITLKGSEFNNGLIEGIDYGTIDLPDGLSADLEIDSETEATLTISGTASSHNFCDDTTMTFFFASTAFSDNRLPISFEIPITISWISPTLSFSATTLEESTDNDGTIDDTFTITASGGGQFLHDGSSTTSGVFLDSDDFTWTLPEGLTPILNPDPTNPDTVINVSIIGSATSKSPISDITTELKFVSGVGAITDFCSTALKKNIDVTFQRTIIMYDSETNGGNLDGQTGADAQCFIDRPELPEDYTGYKAYLSFDGAHEIRDLHVTGPVPSDLEVESEDGTVLGADMDALLDIDMDTIFLDSTLADAGVTSSVYWTGSNSDGSVSADNCSNFASSNGGVNGTVGDSSVTDSTWLDDAAPLACNSTDNVILCVAYPQ